VSTAAIWASVGSGHKRTMDNDREPPNTPKFGAKMGVLGLSADREQHSSPLGQF
jgi:hypothetical protein